MPFLEPIAVARGVSCCDHLILHHMPFPVTGNGINFNEYHELRVGGGVSKRKSVPVTRDRGNGYSEGKNLTQKFSVTRKLSC